jgi:subtilisin family serine protease
MSLCSVRSPSAIQQGEISKMKKPSITIIFVVTSILSMNVMAGDGSVRHTAARHVANSYFVVLRDDVDADAVGAELGAKHGVKVTSTIRTLLKAFEITATDGQARTISSDPRVKYVEDNALSSGTATQIPAPSWGLDRIDQQFLPYDNYYKYDYTGQGVTVYILDSGVNPIADLSGRIARQINFVTVSGVRDPNNYADCFDHGTKVADIVGGTYYGVAKNATIVNVRVLDCFNVGSEADTVAGMDWIVNDFISHGTPAVINYSARFFGLDQAMDDAVMRALNMGITFVCSAGNESADACLDSPGHLSIPSNYSPNPNQYSTLTVSGTKEDDSFNSGLNWGPCVSILAPGFDLPVYDHNGNSSIFGATSGATPFVSGVAALHLERFPVATPSVIGGYIKTYGTPNKITGLPAGTPNLLLYNSIIERHHACCVY